ncbi:hypothetical protein GJ496_004381 [Pomphorhynchus laevis]|nr:hypothetical protein GJ496_004381 [Pomphorhynchus laevis]
MRRKRQSSGSYQSESDEEGPNWRRQYDQGANRKKRRDMDRSDRLELLVYKLAERDASAIESDIERLSEVLLADMIEHQTKINELLLFCIFEVPEKITIYSTLIGVMNARNSSFGSGFLQSLWTELHRCLSRGEFTHVQRIIRFICDLINSKVITAESLLNLLGILINTADDSSGGERRSDFFIYIVLSSLPWCGKQLYESRPQALNQLLNSIYEYVQSGKRQKLYLPLLQVWSSQEPHLQEDYLGCLVEQIKHLVEDEWVESQIVRPYRAFDSVLCDAVSHQFPQLELLTADEEESNELVYPLPKVIFRMFDYTDVPDNFILPGSHSIERFLIEDQLSNIIHTYHLERKSCAMYLLNHKVQRNIPLDYIIVEVIFGQLFTLPNSPHIELFYGAMLIELCKMRPASLPQVLAQATELIFDRLSTMKAICIERYVTWFSYNLSNFQLRWSWDYWSYVFDDPIQKSPPQSTDVENIADVSVANQSLSNFDREIKIHIIREVMQKLIRFSYYSALVQTTPACFHPLIPSTMAPHYKYSPGSTTGNENAAVVTTLADNKLVDVQLENDDENTVVVIKHQPETGDNGASNSVGDVLESVNDTGNVDDVSLERREHYKKSLALKLRSAMQDKASIFEIQQLIQNSAHSYNFDSNLTMDIFFTTLLYLGAKTFSHTYAALVKYHTLLRTMVDSDEQKQIALLNSAYSVWYTHQQMIVFLVDKLLRAQIIDCIAISTWIFSPTMHDQLMNHYVWEILHNTVRFERNKLNDNPEQNPHQLTDDYDKDEQICTVKNMFLTILQRMVVVISDYIENSEQLGEDPFATTWYKWMSERLQAILLTFHAEIRLFINTLEALIFTPNVQFCLLEIFQQFCSVHV